MSASTAHAYTTERPRLAEHEARWEDLFRRSGFTRTPHSFFALFRSFSIVQMAILGNILDRTVGFVPTKAMSQRPEWVRITEREFARMLGASENGIALALDALEEKAVIESRTVGRNKEYRVLMENWAKVSPKAPRRLTRKPPAVEVDLLEPDDDDDDLEDEEIRASTAPRQRAALRVAGGKRKEPLVLFPGKDTAVPLSEVCSGSQCPLHNGRIEGDDKEAAKKRRTEAAQPVTDGIPPVECGNKKGVVLTGETGQFDLAGLSLRYRNLQAQPVALVARVEAGVLDLAVSPVVELQTNWSDLELGLNRLLQERLGPVPAKVLERIELERGAATDAQILAKLQSRGKLFENPRASWGGVLLLVKEAAENCARAAATELGAARRDHEKQEAEYAEAYMSGLAEARRLLADPFLPTEDRNSLLRMYKELHDWTPSESEIAKTVEGHAIRSAKTLADRTASAAAKRIARERMDQIQGSYPEIAAMVAAMGRPN